MTTIELPVRQTGVCCELEMPFDAAWATGTADLLKALADPTRLGMAACLWESPAPICICDFTAAFGLSQSTISHHMGKLRAAGIVESEKHGLWVYYRLRGDLPADVRELIGLLARAGARSVPTG